MMPLAATAPLINQSPMNNSWFTGVGDFLSMGLDTWLKVEQVNAAKDAGAISQHELSNTVQNPQTGVNQNIAAQMQQQMGKGLQVGVGTLGAVVAGVAILYWLTRK
ncbi:hypothetical protein [Shewanella baltica]|uniref:hypothetical protein n=1 Tax=Shewanella baltica TaxID=62322 RepID=UPI003D792A7F